MLYCCKSTYAGFVMPPIGYPGNSATKTARAKAGGGFESAMVGSATTLATGQSITITGTGFGAVADPRPSTSDIFDYALPAGTLVPDGAGTNWTQNGSSFSEPFELDDSIVLPGRTFSAKARGRKAVMQQPIITGSALSARSFYSQHWQYFNESLSTPPQLDANRSDKIIRMWDGDEECGTRMSWLASSWRCYITHPVDYNTCRAGSGSDYVWDIYPGNSPWGVGQVWRRVETVWTDNGDNSCDVSLRIDGKEIHKFIGVFHPPAFVNSEWAQTVVGFDSGIPERLTETVRTWLADHVTQGNPARVELSNNSTYDPSVEQKRYYQLCTSRSDTEVVISSAMLGDLDTGLPVYMHAIKSDDSATTVELVEGTNLVIT